MCSIGEDDFGDDGGVHSMIKDIKSMEIVEEEICKKCLQEKSVIKLDFKEIMCVSCFMKYARHKFRATLGATKIVRRGSKVLLNFSGVNNDVCLLDMIKHGFEAEAYKRLGFDLEVVYVDENCIYEDDMGVRFKKIQDLQKVLQQFSNFNCYYSTICDHKKLFQLNDLTLDELSMIMKSEIEFQKLFNSIETLTSKQDFLETKRNENLRHIAVNLKCQSVFLSDIGIDLAKRLIGNISLGRGASVAYDVAFCDDRIENIKFIRPLKDLNAKEVESYINFNNLQTITRSCYGSTNGPFSSIQNLTSKFIDDLQENYSSTVSTVFRTCSKIAPRSNATSVDGTISKALDIECINDMNKRCYLCKSYLDYQQSNTLYAIEFSRYVSEIADNQQSLQNTEQIEEKALQSISDGKKNLCHGCRNIFIGVDDDLIE
jgi:cytoplasmic tRNA 2-thiolation protein 2